MHTRLAQPRSRPAPPSLPFEASVPLGVDRTFSLVGEAAVLCAFSNLFAAPLLFLSPLLSAAKKFVKARNADGSETSSGAIVAEGDGVFERARGRAPV